MAARSARCVTASRTATANPTMPATSSVPDRTPRSWPAALQQRHNGGLPAQQQDPVAGRPADLVPGDGQRVGAAGGEIERELAERLDGVGVKRDAVRMRDGGEFTNRVDRADLVVGPHHRDHRDIGRVLGDGGGQRVGVHPAEVVDLQPADQGAFVLGQEFDDIEHGVVLDGGRR